MKDLEVWENMYIWLFLMIYVYKRLGRLEDWKIVRVEDSLNNVWSIIEEDPFV